MYATDPGTTASRAIAKVPAHGTVVTVNADETLLAGTITEGSVPDEPPPPAGTSTSLGTNSRGQLGRDNYPGKGSMMERRLAARLPMQLFVVNTATGEMKTILRSTDWLNHVQFSPTDPALLLFCHEGPWHKVDRTWTIRTDGTGLTQIHHRTMNMEIEGHEFFSADGRTIWYDLQTPRSEVFWLAGYELATGKRTGITSNAASGQCISISLPTGRSLPGTVAGLPASPRQATVNGFISSVPSSCPTARMAHCHTPPTSFSPASCERRNW